MKHIIALALVCLGLGVDANGNQNLDVALSLCFFFGSIYLARPAANALLSISAAVFPAKQAAGLKVKRSRR